MVFPGLPHVLQCLQKAAMCLGAEVVINPNAFQWSPVSNEGVGEHPLQGCPFLALPPAELTSSLPGIFSDGSFDADQGKCA